MQVLSLSTSVGRGFALSFAVCVKSPNDTVDPEACTVVVHDQNTTRSTSDGSISESGWSLDFRAAVDASCTLDKVISGHCSACTAAAAIAGTCPVGRHTIVTDIVAPGGLQSQTSLAVVVNVGAALFSVEVTLRFELVSDSRGLPVSSQADARLRTMIVASQVWLCICCHVLCHSYGLCHTCAWDVSKTGLVDLTFDKKVWTFHRYGCIIRSCCPL